MFNYITAVLLLLCATTSAQAGVFVGFGAAGGGGGGTDLLYPDGDVNIAWLQSNDNNVGTNHYLRMDDTEGNEINTNSDSLYAMGGNRDEYTLTNPSSMGAGDTATAIEVAVYGRGQGATCNIQTQYSVNGSTWTTINTATLPADTFAYIATSATGLSLSQTDINALRISIQRTGGAICDISNVIVEVTY